CTYPPTVPFSAGQSRFWVSVPLSRIVDSFVPHPAGSGRGEVAMARWPLLYTATNMAAHMLSEGVTACGNCNRQRKGQIEAQLPDIVSAGGRGITAIGKLL
ncbi:hypothetical protein XELAEV_18003394mg, partial [Xenopus laevis]